MITFVLLAALAVVLIAVLGSRSSADKRGRATAQLGKTDDRVTVATSSEPRADEPEASRLRQHGFDLGVGYTRTEIHAAVGGGVQDYLPHVAGRVVAGCFNPQLNPDAPDVVLPGFGPEIERWAEVFAQQGFAVPCFLKRATNSWEYVGDFRVRQLSRDAADVARWAAIAERDGDVSMVLQLEEV